MRQTLLFGGLEAVAYNINRKNKDLKLYEFGNCYFKENSSDNTDPILKYKQSKHLGIFITGLKARKNWNVDYGDTSIYFLKSYVENILKRMGLDTNRLDVVNINKKIYKGGIRLISDNKTIVEYGIISSNILKSFDIDNEVHFAEFNWDLLSSMIKLRVNFSELPKYPEVKRDLAILLDKNVSFDSIRKIALNTEKYLLKKIDLFDVFEGDKIGENKKSYAVSFIIQDKKRTLTDKQIEKIMKKIQKALEEQLGAKIR